MKATKTIPEIKTVIKELQEKGPQVARDKFNNDGLLAAIISLLDLDSKTFLILVTIIEGMLGIKMPTRYDDAIAYIAQKLDTQSIMKIALITVLGRLNESE